MTVPTPVLALDPVTRAFTFTARAELVEFIVGKLIDLTYPYEWTEKGATIAEMTELAMEAFLSLKETEILRIGDVVLHAGMYPPEGRLWCDGAEYSATEYPDLAEVLGPNFDIGDGKFVVPDFRFCFPIGGGIYDGVGDDVGSMGGQTHINLYSHDDNGPHTHTTHSHTTALVVGPGEIPVSAPGLIEDTGSSGSSADIEIVPPFSAVNFTIVYRGVKP